MASDTDKNLIAIRGIRQHYDERKRIEDVANQSEIVKQRLHYHFAKVGGGWNIPEGLPFMKEFLNEVDKLCKLTSTK